MKASGRSVGGPGVATLVAAICIAPLAAAQKSDELASTAQRAINAPIDEVIGQAPTAHPLSMFFLARRLLEAGRRDEALFWFYEGQLRWRARMEETPNPPERAQYRRLFDQVGPEINAYSFCDMDAFAQMVERVIAWDTEHPDATGEAAKAHVRQGLRELVGYAREHSAEISRERCNAYSTDPFIGSGGAFLGAPEDMVQPYDEARFASFRVGVTTGEQVIAALGRPESWSNEGNSTTFGYSYMRAFLPGFMSERVQVSFDFDRNRVLREIHLPRAR